MHYKYCLIHHNTARQFPLARPHLLNQIKRVNIHNGYNGPRKKNGYNGVLKLPRIEVTKNRLVRADLVLNFKISCNCYSWIQKLVNFSSINPLLLFNVFYGQNLFIYSLDLTQCICIPFGSMAQTRSLWWGDHGSRDRNVSSWIWSILRCKKTKAELKKCCSRVSWKLWMCYRDINENEY